MLEQMRALGALTSLMKDRQRLADAADRVRQRLEAARVQGQAGQGAVQVTVTGTLRVVEVRIEPAVGSAFSADPQSKALAEGFIAQATNEAMAKAQQLAKDTLAQEAKALGLPEELAGQLSGSLGGALVGSAGPAAGP